MDKTRIFWGIVLLLVVILLALLDIFLLNLAIFAVVLFLAFKEAKALFGLENPPFWPLLIAFILGSFYDKVLFFGICVAVLFIFYLIYKNSPNLNLALIYIYPSLPIFALWQLYLSFGIFALFWLISIVAASDGFAYIFGKKFGSRKLCQASPNKTIEGLIGGVFSACVVGVIIGVFEFSFLFALFCSFFVAIFGVIGDLLESYFKRKANVKDSGNLIPGHGGILDRIDAVIIASFVLLAFL